MKLFVPNANLDTIQDAMETILNSAAQRDNLRKTQDIAGTTYNHALFPIESAQAAAWRAAVAAAGGFYYFVDGNRALVEANTPSASQQYGTVWSHGTAAADIAAQLPTLVIYIDDSLAEYTDAYDGDANAGSRETGGAFEAFPTFEAAFAALQDYRLTKTIVRDNGQRNYLRYTQVNDNIVPAFYSPANKPIHVTSDIEHGEWAEIGVHPDDITQFNTDPDQDLVGGQILLRTNSNGSVYEYFSLYGLQSLAQGRFDYTDVGIGSQSGGPTIYDTRVTGVKFIENRHCAVKGVGPGTLIEQCTFTNIGAMKFDHCAYITASPDPSRPIILRWNFSDEVSGLFLRGVADSGTVPWYGEVYGNVINRCHHAGVEMSNRPALKVAHNTFVNISQGLPPLGGFSTDGLLRLGTQNGGGSILVNNLMAVYGSYVFTLNSTSAGWAAPIAVTIGDNWIEKAASFNGSSAISVQEWIDHWTGDGSDHYAPKDGAFTPDFTDIDGDAPEDFALDAALDAGRDASSLIPDIRLLDAALTAANGYPTPEASYSASSVGAFAVSA